MKKYQYLVFVVRGEDLEFYLNKYGKDGFDLVQMFKNQSNPHCFDVVLQKEINEK